MRIHSASTVVQALQALDLTAQSASREATTISFPGQHQGRER